MKTIWINTIRISLAVWVFALGSCTGDFFDINKNAEQPASWEIPLRIQVGSAFQSMLNEVITSQDVPYQVTDVLGPGAYGRYFGYSQDNKWSVSFAFYNAQDGWLNSHFNRAFNNLYVDYGTIVSLEEEPGIWSWLGRIVIVAGMHRVTDKHGPIPYSKINLLNPGIATEYDSQEVVYHAMLDDLENAVAFLTDYAQSSPVASSVAGFDKLYGGDVGKWIKFANSLRLRLAMRMRFADDTKAKQVVDQVLAHTYGVFESNDDNAALTLTKVHPLYVTVFNYDDTRAASEIVCYMSGWNDPRLPVYFEKAEGGTASGYAGVRIGTKTSLNTGGGKYSCPAARESDKMLWMNAAEVAFLKAEAELKWNNVGETTENLYKRGIELSFEQHGVSSAAAAYIADNTSVPSAYVDPYYSHSYSPAITLKVAWSGTTDEIALEQIITQKWLAMYPLCMEAWSEHRRTGYPRIFPSLNNANTDGTLTTRGASRIPYPPQEKFNNPDNYPVALTLLGGEDLYGIRLWWDKKSGKPNF